MPSPAPSPKSSKAMKEKTLTEFLRENPTFIEDLLEAAKRLGKGKNNVLSCALERRATTLRQYEPNDSPFSSNKQ